MRKANGTKSTSEAEIYDDLIKLKRKFTYGNGRRYHGSARLPVEPTEDLQV